MSDQNEYDSKIKAALALRNSGDRVGAIAGMRAALAVDPSKAGAWAALGQLLKDEGSLGEAITCLQEAARLRPKRDLYSGALFFALMRAERWTEATEVAERFLELVARGEAKCAPDVEQSMKDFLEDPEEFKQKWNAEG